MTRMPFVYDDGGRSAAGYRGTAGDCVCRSVAITSGRPYAEVYGALARGAGNERGSRGETARSGIHVRRRWFRDYMNGLGFTWVPTMRVGQGCRVHLVADELPGGRLVVQVSKHCTAVIDGVVRDTHDPQRQTSVAENGGPWRKVERCVYGYWRLAPQAGGATGVVPGAPIPDGGGKEKE